jgi:HlyD family secretion protein
VSNTGDVLKIPGQAVRFRPKIGGATAGDQNRPTSAATVWVVSGGGEPRPISVKLGASDDTGAALLEGSLNEGQQLIIGMANSQKRRNYLGFRVGF